MINQSIYGGQTGDGMADFSGPSPTGDWFDDNAPDPASVRPGVDPSQIGANNTGVTGQGFQGQAASDPQSDFMRIFGQYAPSAKNLEDHWTEFTALHPGWQLKKNASGYADAIVGPNGEIIDTQRNAGYDRSDAWQWSPQGSGGGSASFGNLYNAGAFAWPTFTPPSYTPPPVFKAPTLDEAAAQPGYQFASREGRKALDNAAAHDGVLRTGGHLKDLYAWGDQFATQNYSNVLKQAEDVYKINADQNQNTYLNNYRGAVDAFSPTFDAAKLGFNDLYSRWRDSLNATTQIATAGAGL